MLKVTSPSVWISRIMISWGIGSSLFRAHCHRPSLTLSFRPIVMACMAAVHVSELSPFHARRLLSQFGPRRTTAVFWRAASVRTISSFSSTRREKLTVDLSQSSALSKAVTLLRSSTLGRFGTRRRKWRPEFCFSTSPILRYVGFSEPTKSGTNTYVNFQQSGGFSGLFAYAVSFANGRLAGWQVLFILEGLLTIALGAAVYFILPDWPHVSLSP